VRVESGAGKREILQVQILQVGHLNSVPTAAAGRFGWQGGVRVLGGGFAFA